MFRQAGVVARGVAWGRQRTHARVDTSEGGVRGRNVRRASCVSGRSFGGHVEGVWVMVAMRAVLVVVVVQILVVVV